MPTFAYHSKSTSVELLHAWAGAAMANAANASAYLGIALMVISWEKLRRPLSRTPGRRSVRGRTQLPLCGSLGVAADEIGHALHARLDLLLRSRVGEAHVLAFARHPAAEVDVGEHRHARLVQ